MCGNSRYDNLRQCKVASMTNMGEFVLYVLDMLHDFGLVKATAMFGGYGIYRDGIIFAIVVDDTLYIKADDNNRALFEKKDLSRFSYMKKGKECSMSYYMVPEEAIDDKSALCYWAREGYGAALRSQ